MGFARYLVKQYSGFCEMFPQQPYFYGPQPGGGMMQNQITPLQLVPQPPPSLLEAILITGGLGLLAYGLLSALSPDEPKRTCGACGRLGHNRTTCPHDGPRMRFSRAIPRSPQCQFCGQYRYGTSRHHPRGRADISDHLDVCLDCHKECCHEGDFRNIAIKPRICRVLDRPAWWRMKSALS